MNAECRRGSVFLDCQLLFGSADHAKLRAEDDGFQCGADAKFTTLQLLQHFVQRRLELTPPLGPTLLLGMS